MRRATRRSIGQTLLKRKLDVALIALIAILIALVLWNRGGRPFQSVEVTFSDALRSGMLIVPASCASAPPLAPNNDYGLQVPSGATNREINRLDINFCITNTGGPTYFVPLYSKAELQDFYNATSHLPGITTTPN